MDLLFLGCTFHVKNLSWKSSSSIEMTFDVSNIKQRCTDRRRNCNQEYKSTYFLKIINLYL